MNINKEYNKEKTKQKLLVITAFVLIVVGYYNFNLNNKEDFLEVSSRSNEINLGDVELVNSDPVNSDPVNSNQVNSNLVNIESTSDAIVPNDEVKKNNYFEDTKIQRDRMYSEIIETYQNMVDSQNISAEQKAIAIQEISNISNIKNGIMISENLIKNKGFEEVVILVNNGKINVVLGNKKLSTEQISQIQNIIEKQFNTKVENINISFNE